MKIKLLPVFILFFTFTIQAEDVCLLTGFEPFGGAKTNPSWDAIKELHGTKRLGMRIECVQLPVVYDQMAKPLEDAIAKFKPKVVICFGQGGYEFRVETVALNGYNKGKYPDNNGNPPLRDAIIPGKDEQLPTDLPAEAILAELKKNKLHTISSKDAGGYLCNECFYRLMAVPRGKIDTDPAPSGTGTQHERALVQRGFVHVPIPNSKNPLGTTFTLDEIKRGVLIVVDLSVQTANRIINPQHSF